MDLDEAMEVIKGLRSALELAYFERDSIKEADVEKELKGSAAFMVKHGYTDDMIDAERPE